MLDASPKVYSVTELNNYVKGKLDNDENLKYIYVAGEISNYKSHYSGHMYMTVKDESSAVKAVMFAGNASKLRFRPENGMKIIALGTVSLFPRDGSFQLYIGSMQPDGVGALSIAYEQLKKKLQNEGLFDAKYKKTIPKFPSRVGVITSATGAAVQDIFNVLKRRYPVAEVVVRSAQVQGEGAAEDISAAIREFNELKGADVLIVGRGGGSIEDLWAFNEEVLARAVFSSEIPVISAVGHETDYTICDFVADLRAPTPSAAAEIAVPDIRELKAELISNKQYLYNVVRNRIGIERSRLLAMEKCVSKNEPVNKINDNRRNLLYLNERMNELARKSVDRNRMVYSRLAGKLDALSPLKVISRGYALVSTGESIVKSTKDISHGDELDVLVSDGAFRARVTDIDGD